MANLGGEVPASAKAVKKGGAAPTAPTAPTAAAAAPKGGKGKKKEGGIDLATAMAYAIPDEKFSYKERDTALYVFQ